jgi:hypothetical protein
VGGTSNLAKLAPFTPFGIDFNSSTSHIVLLFVLSVSKSGIRQQPLVQVMVNPTVNLAYSIVFAMRIYPATNPAIWTGGRYHAVRSQHQRFLTCTGGRIGKWEKWVGYEQEL